LREEPSARPPRTRQSASALERQLTLLERLAPLNAAFEEGGEKGDWMAARDWPAEPPLRAKAKPIPPKRSFS
jgi:hypothetical protein